MKVREVMSRLASYDGDLDVRVESVPDHTGEPGASDVGVLSIMTAPLDGQDDSAEPDWIVLTLDWPEAQQATPPSTA